MYFVKVLFSKMALEKIITPRILCGIRRGKGKQRREKKMGKKNNLSKLFENNFENKIIDGATQTRKSQPKSKMAK